MKKYNYESIENFKEWDKVFDYESDENTVVLLDKKGNKIAEFGYGSFIDSDLIRFKNKMPHKL